MDEEIRLKVDTEANAAYLSLGEVGVGGSHHTMPVEDEHGEVVLVVDFSAEGRVAGVEFLNARAQLSTSLYERHR